MSHLRRVTLLKDIGRHLGVDEVDEIVDRSPRQRRHLDAVMNDPHKVAPLRLPDLARPQHTCAQANTD